ncbi:ATP-binding protein [Streptomyces sp. NPDC002659]|uniref:ATP-binding protein n=1 Tax=Streptomyces sp. NPDC002659 TaxID=3364656 RepID=UPI0036C05E56
MGKRQLTTSRHSALSGDLHAPRTARSFVRTAIADWTPEALPAEITERLTHDATLLVSELVTNAVVHAGTTVELYCRLVAGETEGEEFASLVVEVSDDHPMRPLLPGDANTYATHGRGLQLVAAIAESWGISYHRDLKTVWFRLPIRSPGDLEVPVPAPRVEQLFQ